MTMTTGEHGPTAREVREATGRHTDWLVATASALSDGGGPSLCAGWTRGHILTHIARNADGMCAMVRAALDGTGETMYASQERRDADIDGGSGRAMAALVADVRETGARVADALARLDGIGADVRVDRLPGGPQFRAVDLPRMRLREVVYHHVDLDAGFGFEDVEPELVATFLQLEAGRAGLPAMTLAPDGGGPIDVGGGGRRITGTAPALVRWLARRAPDGVSAADGADLPPIPRGL